MKFRRQISLAPILSLFLLISCGKRWQNRNGLSETIFRTEVITHYNYSSTSHGYKEEFTGKNLRHFNSDGKLIRHISFHSNGTIASSTTTKYDTSGNPRETLLYEYDSTGFLIEKSTRAYVQNRLMRKVTYSGSTDYRYDFDGDGNLIEEERKSLFRMPLARKSLSARSSIKFREHERKSLRKFRYDSEGTMIEEEDSTFLDGKLLRKSVIRFDARGNETERISYDSEGELVTRSTSNFRYDTNGNVTEVSYQVWPDIEEPNWVTRVIYYDELGFEETTGFRKISVFDSLNRVIEVREYGYKLGDGEIEEIPKSRTEYFYDSQGRLVTVRGYDFRYVNGEIEEIPKSRSTYQYGINATRIAERNGTAYLGKHFTGKVFQYFDDGRLKSQGYYTNGKRDGQWINYDKDGGILEIRDYEGNTQGDN